MSFQTIAEETRPSVDEVEHLVMKALRVSVSFTSLGTSSNLRAISISSLKLIHGFLDEKAHITWVQPGVLSQEQIGGLAKAGGLRG